MSLLDDKSYKTYNLRICDFFIYEFKLYLQHMMELLGQLLRHRKKGQKMKMLLKP
jgi:hypothetical protein